ncbi:MAG: VapC toxin family PIN domain ribonuclease [Acidobacteria bacterium]|nr:MAG: VapC toxin family PIN domain ribonuclease [Acidobacteriota bacterium]
MGAPHPGKNDTLQILERLASERQRLVTDAEVLQEIIRRYIAIHRRDAIQPGFHALLRITDEVFSIDRAAAERAKEIILSHPRLSARDAIHLAVMEQHGVDRILSFDSSFEGYPGMARIS